jgi:predicted CXXCH cytochrome family protein
LALRSKTFILFAFIFIFILYSLFAEAKTGIIVTRHNLSVTGPGEIKAIIETRVCVFCHTPHNAFPRTPLWNRDLGPQNYEIYESSTIVARPKQPDGPSRLCLSCHDGTVAIGAVLRPAEGIAMTREITPERPSYIGTFLKDDHPVSFSYYESLTNPEIRTNLPQDLTFYGAGYIHCSTCHDPHDNTYGKFLVTDNRASALCVKCHNKDGWVTSSHKNSIKVLLNPLPGLEWTNWVTVSDYGCESCHKPHSAGGPERLLRYLNEEDNCLICHNGTVAEKDIQSQIQSFSNHPVSATRGLHDPIEDPRLTTNRHVECVDCHNPHASDNTSAIPPAVSGRLKKVSGVDKDGNPIYRNVASGTSASYEYEICFKCHSDFETLSPYIPRVEAERNKRLKFSSTNLSYHPVISIGKNTNVPSLNPPSLDAPDYVRDLKESSQIYCFDCHSDDNELSKGPHGSQFRPILMRRYETEIQSGQPSQNYALCFRCHNVNSILSDQSFKHRKHIEDLGTSCSICHDAHGVSNNNHLINFDIRYVDTNPSPQFIDYGTFSGSCALVCHYDPNNRNIVKVHDHNNSRY